MTTGENGFVREKTTEKLKPPTGSLELQQINGSLLQNHRGFLQLLELPVESESLLRIDGASYRFNGASYGIAGASYGSSGAS